MNPQAQTLKLTPQQLATMLVFDAQIAQLQLAANQLGTFMGMAREADALIASMQLLQKVRGELADEWQRKIQVVGASEMPRQAPPLVAP